MGTRNEGDGYLILVQICCMIEIDIFDAVMYIVNKFMHYNDAIY